MLFSSNHPIGIINNPLVVSVWEVTQKNSLPNPVTGDFIITESGSNITTESGDQLITE